MNAHYSYEPECVKGKPDGYYLLRSPGDEQGTLVYLYNHADFKGRRHLAFGAQDGGGLLPVADLRDDATFTPVQIVEEEERWWTFCNCNECQSAAEQFAKKGIMPITQSRQFFRCDCGQLWLREPGLDEARDLLAGAAALLKDKLTPNEGQLRTSWDKDVDQWLIAAAPWAAEDVCYGHVIACHGCGEILGYSLRG